MVQPLVQLRTAILALGVLTSGLLAVSPADAAPTQHKTHSRGHCAVCRRIVSPKQAFKHIATRRPDRLVRRHVTSLISKARTNPHGTNDDAALPTVSTVTVEADVQESPALEPIGVLIPEYAQLKTHEGLVRRSPRGPPALS
jgi:hypothetical protein